MAEKRRTWTATRIFTLVIVGVFFFSSVGISGLVIYDIIKGDDNSSSDVSVNEPKEGEKLQGTKLESYTPVAKVEKFEYLDIKKGTGPAVKSTDTITAHYTGALAKDGKIF